MYRKLRDDVKLLRFFRGISKFKIRSQVPVANLSDEKNIPDDFLTK